MRKPDDSASTEEGPAEGFYGRWSRRKRAARDGTPADDVSPAEQPVEVPAGELAAPAPGADIDAADRGDAERVLTDADMPPLESLGDDDDYSGFMSPGVSEELRQAALRKLFMSSQFNVLDGLNDYDDDFTTFEALGDIVTADMRHRAEQEAARAKREAEERARGLMAEESDTVQAADEVAAETGSDVETADDPAGDTPAAAPGEVTPLSEAEQRSSDFAPEAPNRDV